MYRAEDKYVIPENDYFELQERLSAVLPYDENALSDWYSVSSLYFDDIEDTDYFDAVSGNPYRRKRRIRIYNGSMDDIKLEVKTKQYSRILKRSSTISRDEMESLMRGKLIGWGTDRDDPRSVFNEAIACGHLSPRVIITYDRKAFVYEFGNTRITFDRNIRATDRTGLFGTDGIAYDSPYDGTYVLEVKYDEFIPDFILQVLEIDSMQQTSFSKYRICRDIYEGREER